MKTKNSGFGERRTHNISQRLEPSRTATAYRCSFGTSGRSFIRPTLGMAAALSLTSSKMLRQFSNSSGRRRRVKALVTEPSFKGRQIVLAGEFIIHLLIFPRSGGLGAGQPKYKVRALSRCEQHATRRRSLDRPRGALNSAHPHSTPAPRTIQRA